MGRFFRFAAIILSVSLIFQLPGISYSSEDTLRVPLDSRRVSEAQKTVRPACLFGNTEVETYDLPEDFRSIKGLNPIKLWFEAAERAGLKDKLIIGVKGSMAQSNIDESGRPFWPVLSDTDLSFYIDAEDKGSLNRAYWRLNDEFKSMLEEKNIPWSTVWIEVWADDFKECIQIGTEGGKIHFETEAILYRDLFGAYYGQFCGPLYKYYGYHKIIKKTETVLQAGFSQEDILERLNKKYDAWLDNLLGVKIQQFLVGKNSAKSLKVLAWLAEMSGKADLKKELLEKALKYQGLIDKNPFNREELSMLRGSMLEDIIAAIYLLVPSDSEGGKEFYKSLSNGVYARYGIDFRETKVRWKQIKAGIKERYNPFIKQAFRSGTERVTPAFLSEQLRYANPWEVAGKFEGHVTPLFISTEHSSTYTIVINGIEEGHVHPSNTILVNFDRHEDMALDGERFLMSNNWLRVLLEHGKISGMEWFDGKKRMVEDFRKTGKLKGGDIVISVDIDYFLNFPEEKRKEAMDNLVEFIKVYDENIKIISIALSPDYCPGINPEQVAHELCGRLNTVYSPEPWYLSKVSYLKECGVCIRGLRNIELERGFFLPRPKSRSML